ncbi:MAG: FHA domain-containing protein [Gemmataceae bacterium]
MSFRLFIHYCAFCGGWAAFFGWVLGRLASVPGFHPVFNSTIKGIFLGMMVAFGLGLVDALWNLGWRQPVQIVSRVAVAVLVGSIGGLTGALVGSLLYSLIPWDIFIILGWTLTGLLIGASVGMFDILSNVLRDENMGGSLRKVVNGVIGGTMGGLLGGVLSVLLRGFWMNIFHDKSSDMLWSPSAMGFVALGMCIGLFIGLAQVILKEAWLRVESGFRPGREMILSKPETTIGRAESCDLGLFGDPDIERLHARIVRRNNGYVLEDAGFTTGTLLNGQRIHEPVPLRLGDAIQVGRSVLRFGERKKSS